MVVFDFVSRSTVACSFEIVGVGFTATSKTIGATVPPTEMPPRMPPQRLVFNCGPGKTKLSLFVEPVNSVASNPLPNSTPLHAGTAKHKAAILASMPSKIGPPMPPGMP